MSLLDQPQGIQLPWDSVAHMDGITLFCPPVIPLSDVTPARQLLTAAQTHFLLVGHMHQDTNHEEYFAPLPPCGAGKISRLLLSSIFSTAALRQGKVRLAPFPASGSAFCRKLRSLPCPSFQT